MQDWYSTWDNYYHERNDLEILHRLNERFTHKVIPYSTKDISRIREFSNPYISARGFSAARRRKVSEAESGPSHTTRKELDAESSFESPRMFIGTNHYIGLLPASARADDVIVQFWNCDAALVLRPEKAAKLEMLLEDVDLSTFVFSVIGRADIVDQTDHVMKGFDLLKNTNIAVYVDLDFHTLQALSASIDLGTNLDLN